MAVMLKLVRKDHAKADLIEIADYFNATGHEQLSERFLVKVKEALDLLLGLPGSGSPREYGIPGLRAFPVPQFGNYLIFYVSTETELHLLHILHGARDLVTVLSTTQE